MGELIGIARHDRPRGPIETLTTGRLDVNAGLEGDRGGLMTNRKVTLLFEHQWRAALAQINRTEIDWSVRRTNFLVRGVENPRRSGAKIRLGEALLEVSMECEPCDRMDAQVPGLTDALTPDWRGGACCRVLEGGEIKLGDRVEMISVDLAGAGVLAFWLNEVGRTGWFKTDPGVDQAIRDRFTSVYQAAARGDLDAWRATPAGALALIIALDQFPRNMFRDHAKAFATDAKARAVALEAISNGFDLQTPEPDRMMFYLPLEHSEVLEDQDLCVSLISERLRSEQEGVRHAEAHRDLIRRFGRFPHRNEALGRPSTAEEAEFLLGGGYQPNSDNADDP
ncbi:MAG: DUF924 family protein [Pseudomonadota bacterium]